MKLPRVLLVSLIALSIACSSGGSSQDPGVTGGGGPAGGAPDTNPDGVAYPSDHVGTTARAGSAPGDRIHNYKFLGYPNGDVTQGLKPVSLAEFFDPQGKRYKLIHIQASGSWCVHCQKEIEVVSTLKAELDQRGVVWLVSLAEGPTEGQPATQDDLDKWIQRYKPPYTHLLDPGNANLGPFYDDAALPWNANISARTMEIVTAGVGAIEVADVVLKDVDDALAQAAKTGAGTLP